MFRVHKVGKEDQFVMQEGIDHTEDWRKRISEFNQAHFNKCEIGD